MPSLRLAVEVSQLEAFSLSAAQLEQQLEREEKQDRQEILQVNSKACQLAAIASVLCSDCRTPQKRIAHVEELAFQVRDYCCVTL